jgi:rSAM/selenodomain-associated transferase 2
VISVVIPTLNEAAEIAETILSVLSQPGVVEVIVVDGGSTDATVWIAEDSGARVIHSKRGRGRQMHAGALAADGEVLWFVHADTRPGPDTARQLLDALSAGLAAGGNCTLTFDGPALGARILNLVQPLMRRLHCYYSDSTIFVRRDLYFALGGFRSYPLFEDADLIARVRSAGRFVSVRGTVRTSSRRFEQRGFLRTCARWSALQLLFWIGVPAETLGGLYQPIRRPQD